MTKGGGSLPSPSAIFGHFRQALGAAGTTPSTGQLNIINGLGIKGPTIANFVALELLI